MNGITRLPAAVWSGIKATFGFCDPAALCPDPAAAISPAGIPVRAIVPGESYLVKCGAAEAELIGLVLTHVPQRATETLGAEVGLFVAACRAAGLDGRQVSVLLHRRQHFKRTNRLRRTEQISGDAVRGCAHV